MKKLILVPTLLFTLLGFGQNGDSLLANKYYTIALDNYQKGNRDSSLFYLLKGETLCINSKLPLSYIDNLLLQTNIYILNRKYTKATEVSEELLLLSNKHLEPDDARFMIIYNNLVVISAFKKEPFKRDTYIDRIKSWIEKYGKTGEQESEYINMLINVGGMTLDDGDYFQTIKYLEQALSIINSTPQKASKYTNYTLVLFQHLGSAQIGLEKFDEAIVSYEKALDVNAKLKYPDKNRSWSLKRRLAYPYLKMGQIEKAIELCMQVLNRKDPYKFAQQKEYDHSIIYHTLGQCYTEKGEFSEAENFLQKAIELRKNYYAKYRGWERHEAIGTSLFRLAELRRKTGEKKAALQILQKSLIHFCENFSDTLSLENPVLNDLIFTFYYLPNTLRSKAELQAELALESGSNEGLDSALQTYQLLLDLIDRDRQRFKAEQSKFFILKQAKTSYESAIRLALNLYTQTGTAKYADMAIRFSEESKAVLLFAALNESQAKSSAFIPDSLILKEQKLKKEWGDYKQKIFRENHSKNVNDSLIADYRKKEFDLKEKLDKFDDFLNKNYSDYYELKQSKSKVTVKGIQKKLKAKDRQLLEFFMGDKEIFVFYITKQSFSYQIIPNTLELRQHINLVIENLHEPRDNSSQELFRSSYLIYNTLLKPLEIAEGADKLIIIPDDILGYLPFEMLCTAIPKKGNGTPFLLMDMSISYAFSAKILFSDKSKNWAFQKPSWIGYAPFYEKDNYLAFNREEVSLIEKIRLGTSTSKLDSLATKDDFLNNAPNFSIIHLAMHGYVDDKDPMYSYLSFYKGNHSDQAYKLYAYEIFNQSLDADLTILSACKTGYGPLKKGEGIMSLARAFTYAGCPSTIMSLWESDGAISKDLLAKFYEYMEEGLSIDEALREAKIFYLQHAEPNRRAPYYWANFVLIGDSTPLTNSSPIRWVLLILLISLVSFFGIRKRFKKNHLFD